jgi:hypothetical protein
MMIPGITLNSMPWHLKRLLRRVSDDGDTGIPFEDTPEVPPGQMYPRIPGSLPPQPRAPSYYFPSVGPFWGGPSMFT